MLSLQYHFSDLPGFRQYLGAGLNYTRFSDVSFNAAANTALQPSIKKNSFGFALQAGVDVPVGGGWLLNADAKKVQLATDVSSFGSKVGNFAVDPWLLSLGFGRRFCGRRGSAAADGRRAVDADQIAGSVVALW